MIITKETFAVMVTNTWGNGWEKKITVGWKEETNSCPPSGASVAPEPQHITAPLLLIVAVITFKYYYNQILHCAFFSEEL